MTTTLAKIDNIGIYCVIGLGFFIPISTALTTGLMLLTVLVWLLGGNIQNKLSFYIYHPISKILFVIMLLYILGLFGTIAASEDIKSAFSDLLRLMYIPLLMYYLDDKNKLYVLWAFSAAMLLTLVLALCKMYGGLQIGMEYTAAAIFKSHIKTNYFMSIAAFFLVVQLINFPNYKRILIPVILLMVYYIFFLSVGRIGYLVFALLGLYVCWQQFGKKTFIFGPVAIGLLIGLAYFGSDVFHDRVTLLVQDLEFYQQGGRLLESSLGSRIEFYLTSLGLIKEHIIFGWGTGSFAQAYIQLSQTTQLYVTDNPHSEYLRMGVEFGLVGVCVLLGLFYRLWSLTFQLPLKDKLLAQGIVLSFATGCIINSWLGDFTEGYFFVLTTACLFCSVKTNKFKISQRVVEGV